MSNGGGGESPRTVVIAGSVDPAIAAAKAVTGLLSVIGMAEVLVAARVRFAGAAGVQAITAAADEAERRLSGVSGYLLCLPGSQ